MTVSNDFPLFGMKEDKIIIHSYFLSSLLDSYDFWKEQYGIVSVKDFGAVGDGMHDDTAAIQEAIYASGPDSNGRYRPVYFPAGVYRCHEIQWNNATSLIGAEVGNSVLRYNGEGGSGSTILLNLAIGGATPYAGFYNLTFDGFNPETGTIAEHCYKVTGTTGVDWGFKINNCQFVNCFGDAVDLGLGIVNLHINRVRFDGVGGFCLVFRANNKHENRPVSVNQFTYDNNMSTRFAAAAQAKGYYDGVHWGKGFAKLIDTYGCNFEFNSGRIELNKPLIRYDTRKCIFYVNQTISGSCTTLKLENVFGYFQKQDGGVFIYAPSGRVGATVTNCTFGNVSAMYYSPLEKAIIPRYARSFEFKYNYQQDQGHYLQFKQIEVRNSIPGSTVYNHYRKGDIILMTNPTLNGNIGWICTGPSVGYACPAGYTITTTAKVTALSNTIIITRPDVFGYFGEDAAIIIEGAGADGTDLYTYVTKVDPDSGVIEVKDLPSTSVDPATIKFQTPTFEPFGILGAKQAAAQSDSTATDIDTLREDFNSLLKKLRDAKLIEQ